MFQIGSNMHQEMLTTCCCKQGAPPAPRTSMLPLKPGERLNMQDFFHSEGGSATHELVNIKFRGVAGGKRRDGQLLFCAVIKTCKIFPSTAPAGCSTGPALRWEMGEPQLLSWNRGGRMCAAGERATPVDACTRCIAPRKIAVMLVLGSAW